MSTTDRTAGERVGRWRKRRRTAGCGRMEVFVEDVDRERVRRYALELRAKREAARTSRRLAAVLATVNAPRPVPIDGPTLQRCVLGDEAGEQWRPHVEALLTEVSVESLHDLVLDGVFAFGDYLGAEAHWGIRGTHHEWIQDMAGLALARDAA